MLLENKYYFSSNVKFRRITNFEEKDGKLSISTITIGFTICWS